MKKIPRWTIWIPLIGIVFYRARLEQEDFYEETDKIIVWSCYWIISSMGILVAVAIIFRDSPFLKCPCQ